MMTGENGTPVCMRCLSAFSQKVLSAVVSVLEIIFGVEVFICQKVAISTRDRLCYNKTEFTELDPLKDKVLYIAEASEFPAGNLRARRTYRCPPAGIGFGNTIFSSSEQISRGRIEDNKVAQTRCHLPRMLSYRWKSVGRCLRRNALWCGRL
jgi:hypothetical protein